VASLNVELYQQPESFWVTVEVINQYEHRDKHQSPSYFEDASMIIAGLVEMVSTALELNMGGHMPSEYLLRTEQF